LQALSVKVDFKLAAIRMCALISTAMSTYYQNPGVQQTQPAATGRPHGKASYFGIAASLLVLCGSFLPWVEGTMDGASETIKATEGDGRWTAGLAVVAIVLFIIGLATRKAMIGASAAVPALIATGLAAWNAFDPQRLAETYLKAEGGGLSSEELDALIEQIDFTAMPGVWVVLVCALASVLCGLWAAFKGKQ
jgi:hypothetical protein